MPFHRHAVHARSQTSKGTLALYSFILQPEICYKYHEYAFLFPGISTLNDNPQSKSEEKLPEQDDSASSTSGNESSSSSTSSISDAENSGTFEEENPFTSPVSQLNEEKKKAFETKLYPTEETGNDLHWQIK